MTELAPAPRKPTIIVGDADYARLTDLADVLHDRFPGAADELQAEIDRAHVLPSDHVPDHVVKMGSTVEYATDSGPPRRVVLVFPGDADIAKGRVSILTPVGTALLGLSKGQSITWHSRDGRLQTLTVLEVKGSD